MGRREFRITVRGRLTARFARTFEGVDVESSNGDTVLHGSLDQAQLHGVFERIRDLGLELVRVEAA